jgi:actin-related protein
MVGDFEPGVVLDPGSFFLKSGFVDSDAPRAVFPPIVGRPRHTGVMVGMGQKDSYVGDEGGNMRRGMLTYHNPLSGGLVTNWDDIEKLLHHNFYNEMRVVPEETPFFLAEPVLAPRSQREKFCQMGFETFNVPLYATVMNAMLICYCSGRTGALVVSVGETEGFVCGVGEVEGNSDFPDCSALLGPPARLPVLGKQVTDRLMQLLEDKRGYSFTTRAEREILRDVKEHLCYVATRDGAEGERQYELPDGQVISLAEERHLASEALFDPSLVDESGQGVSDAVAEYEDEFVPEDKQLEIIVAGGSTMFPGFAERLEADLRKKSERRVRVKAPPDRKVSDKIRSVS